MIYSAHDTTLAAVLQFMNYTSWKCIYDLKANSNESAVFFESVDNFGMGHPPVINKDNGTSTCFYEFPYFASNIIYELFLNETADAKEKYYI